MLLQLGIAVPQPGVVAPSHLLLTFGWQKQATAVRWPHPSRPGGLWPLPATPQPAAAVCSQASAG